MKYPRLLLAAGVMSGLLYGTNGFASAPVTFKVTDVPGHWFDTGVDIGTGNRSLAIVKQGIQGTVINFKQKNADGTFTAESRHTITSLLWPSNAQPSEQIDQLSANQDNHSVTLNTPGLHVFVCKLHPYMLAGVIVMIQ